MKSAPLAPVPIEVVAVMRPEAVAPGTVKERPVTEPIVAEAVTPFSLTVVAAGLKLVPVTETDVPLTPLVGVKDVIVGVSAGMTVKTALLVAVLPPTVTDTAPVVAPTGTTTFSDVVVDAETTAAVPLKLTALLAAMGLNPDPPTTTEVPTGPLEGENVVTANPATS